MVKKCTRCKEVMDIDCFPNQKSGKYGKRSTCRTCHREANREYSKTKDGVATGIYMVQKRSSKKRGHHAPRYTKNEFRQWLFSQDNFDHIYGEWTKSGYNRLKAPSVDRIDNEKGYSFDNIQLVDWITNIKLYDKVHMNCSVVQKTIDGKTIARYKSGKEASEATGISRASISLCCNKKQKVTKGYTFEFDTSIVKTKEHTKDEE